jgi:hypothetical protein
MSLWASFFPSFNESFLAGTAFEELAHEGYHILFGKVKRIFYFL